MASRSLNKVQLIGNLTRDPELRYTPTGTAVCTLGLATNRSWTTESGERKEDVEFHRLVAWNKLAELCSQLLSKGRKVYVEGRLQTRSWEDQSGGKRQTTEVVIDDMLLLDSRRDAAPADTVEPPMPTEMPEVKGPTAEPAADKPAPAEKPKEKAPKKDTKEKKQDAPDENVNPDDIPF